MIGYVVNVPNIFVLGPSTLVWKEVLAMTSENPRVNSDMNLPGDVSRRRFVQTVGAGIGIAGVTQLGFAEEKKEAKPTQKAKPE